MMENHDSTESTIPQDLPRIGWKTITALTIVVLVLLAVGFAGGYLPRMKNRQVQQLRAQAIADDVLVVDVVKPRAGNSTVSLSLPGDARAKQQTALYARVTGYLKQWNVDIGDKVTKGQLLAVIDAPEVDANLNQARAAVDQANANVTKSQADVELAQATYDRYKGLVPTGGVTQQQLDEKQSTLNDDMAALIAAKAAVKSAEATVQRLVSQQSFEHIYAPFDGVVTARNYDVGALISESDSAAGHELFDLAEVDRLRIYANVPQSYATMIQPDLQVEFTAANYPGRTFAGKVARTAGSLDPNTRTLRTELDFDNAEGLLFAGMYGEIRFNLKREKPMLTVPSSAVMFAADGSRVAVVDADMKVHLTKVGLGRDFGTEIEITTGLQGGEQVISNPGEKVTEGITVALAGDAAKAKPMPSKAQASLIPTATALSSESK